MTSCIVPIMKWHSECKARFQTRNFLIRQKKLQNSNLYGNLKNLLSRTSKTLILTSLKTFEKWSTIVLWWMIPVTNQIQKTNQRSATSLKTNINLVLKTPTLKTWQIILNPSKLTVLQRKHRLYSSLVRCLKMKNPKTPTILSTRLTKK
jgi:hypothetical protein